MTVVLKFAAKALRGWYHSPEYQEILHLRTDNTVGFVVLAEQSATPG